MEECSLYFDDEFLKKHKGLYIEHTATAHEMEPALCSNMILAYVSHGYGKFYGKYSEHELNEGDIILINSGSQYRFSSSDPNRTMSLYTCVFDPDKLPYSYASITKPFKDIHFFVHFQSGSIITHDTEHMDIRNIMVKIMDEYSYSQPGYEISIKCQLVTVLITLFRLYSISGKNKVPQNNNHIIGYMYNYANRNIYKKCSLSEIADLMHLSPQYICKVFKENVGMTFIEYCNHLRVEKIKDALEKTDRPIYMLYNDYEFSPRYLNKLFKEHTGYNIREYKDNFNYKTNNPLYPK